jgi:hypothetical protein
MAIRSIPAGYHPVTSDKDCWLCLESMEGENDIIAHDTTPSCLDRLFRKKVVNHGDCHPMHFNCTKKYAKKYDECGACKEPIRPFGPPPPRPSIPIYHFFYPLVMTIPIVECVSGKIVTTAGISCGIISALANKHFGINGSIMAVALISALESEGREKSVINAYSGVVIGILGAPFKKQESVMLCGLLGAATVLSYGGGPELAILGGALTSAVIKESKGLFWKIQRIVSRSIGF